MDYNGGSPSPPRRKRVIDRFIPHREGLNFETAFSVASSVRQPDSRASSTHNSGFSGSAGAGYVNGNRFSEEEDDEDDDPTNFKAKESRNARNLYSTLLQSEMFGSDVPRAGSASSLGSSGLHGSVSAGSLAGGLRSSASVDSVSSLGSSGDTAGGSVVGGGGGGGGGGTSISPDRSAGRLASRSRNSVSGSFSGMAPSSSSLSLPTSPRKRREIHSSSTNMLRYSPKKLIRSASDLTDISTGGALSSTLRPESREFLLQPKVQQRAIRQTPYKILDAPGLTDDFYLNLIDWGSSDQLVVGLDRHVYIWNSATGDVAEIADLGEDDMVTSVSWMSTGTHVAVGSAQGQVMIYDAASAKRVRTMGGHYDRVSSLAWNDHLLSTGSRDMSILHRDCRVKDYLVNRIDSHRGEVCGLKWNTDLQQLASGSNDNKLKIWSGLSSQEPLFEFDEHNAAVKGLAWSPHQRGLLASAGGLCDRKIWFWNTLTGKNVSSIDTGSQVCNLAWSPRAKELISSHNNRWKDIVVWKYPTMQPITRLRGHVFRVLHMAMSPDGRSLATGAGDETLRLWSLYDEDRVEEDRSMLDMYQQLR